MLKFIIKILDKISSVKSPVLLGRWCILNKNKNKWKIDMANIDNCGTCSYNHIKNTIKTKVSDMDTLNKHPRL